MLGKDINNQEGHHHGQTSLDYCCYGGSAGMMAVWGCCYGECNYAISIFVRERGEGGRQR